MSYRIIRLCYTFIGCTYILDSTVALEILPNVCNHQPCMMVGFYLNVAIKGEWDANISGVGTFYHLKQVKT